MLASLIDKTIHLNQSRSLLFHQNITIALKLVSIDRDLYLAMYSVHATCHSVTTNRDSEYNLTYHL